MRDGAAAWSGAGLRPQHYPDWKTLGPARPWLEALADNYLLQAGGPGLFHLERLAADGRMLLHGVGMDLGGTAPLNATYLQSLKALAARIRPTVISDHLCFTRSNEHASFELLPVPLTRRSLARVCERVLAAQDVLGARLSLENVSAYVRWAEDEMSEMEFLREICARTGAGVLLDLNNLAVNAWNHPGVVDARRELRKLNVEDVTQYHLAGPREEAEPEGRGGVFLLDTHDRPVRDETLELFREAWGRFGARPFVLERDDEGVSFAELLGEVRRIEQTVPFDTRLRSRDGGTADAAVENQVIEEIDVRMPVHGDEARAAPADSTLTRLFLGALQGVAGATCELRVHLAHETSHRLVTYRDGYETRLATALTASVLDKPAELLGREALQGALLDFYRTAAPAAPLLPESLHGFPAFLATHALARRGAHVVGLVELAIARWRVLVAPDPPPSGDVGSFRPESLFLAPDHALVRADAPIYGLWEGEDGDFVAAARETILLWKASATELVMLRVPEGLAPLARELSGGASLASALVALDEATPAVLRQVSPFVARLVAERGLGAAFTGASR